MAVEPNPPSFEHPLEPDVDRLAQATSTLRLLADPTRLHILWMLIEGDADVSTLAARCTASRTAVSQHLAKLRLAGLVVAQQEGRRSVYSIRDGHLGRLVLESLNHADHLVSGEPSHH